MSHFLACIPFGIFFYVYMLFRFGYRSIRPYPVILLAVVVGIIVFVFGVTLAPTPFIVPTALGVLAGALLAFCVHYFLIPRLPLDNEGRPWFGDPDGSEDTDGLE